MKKLLIIGIVMFVAFFSLGSLVWFVHDKSILPNEEVHKTFSDENVQDITVSGKKSNIKVVQGNQLKLNYNGEKPINYSIHNGILKISEKQKNDIAPSINPFKKNKQNMTIEVPKKKLNDINVSTDVGDIHFDGVHAKTATIWNNISDVNFTKSKVDSVEIKSESSRLSFNQTSFDNGNIKIDNGSIKGNNSIIRDSVFIIGRGNINLKNMKKACDLKAFAKNGSINFAYKDKPEDTLLKLNPSDGKKIVNNPNFEDEKTGDGKNILEFYTNHGDIEIN
ncbi:DUF4097 family beta strand repeat protein [Staphylococcus condimenti]|nr:MULTISPECIES: DUF4097 family beta strand repeat-containing protein [Staphylococcus]AMY06716.1 hypothetical protein A4G25_12570 [Staphylococcus condimenti]APR60618.1 hypothetical protein BTZ13_05090 [Staphylococcus condimenti]MDK8645539.1 DUF4097 family beta strand repeat-containing protein [Staphylococcus condimenti]OFP00441.1 hypothetical protein HMPREF3007_05360 [Staphylococcus sp. HMSC065E08]QQS83819.1 DUF4097 family beta strand repeat protein [Staphylococcus condimenti]